METPTKEFNPTKKDLLTIESLILDIKQKKSKLVSSKVRYENTLSQLKEKYKDVDFNDTNFRRIKNTRQSIKDYLSGIELQIKTLNDELSYKNKLKLEVEFFLRNNKSPAEHNEEIQKVVSHLKALKQKYHEFGKDRTRISSLRVMATEFIDDINLILGKIQ